jgi:hypothetical protein
LELIPDEEDELDPDVELDVEPVDAEDGAETVMASSHILRRRMCDGAGRLGANRKPRSRSKTDDAANSGANNPSGSN